MISLLQFLQVVLPNLLALIRMILATAMLVMLVHLRPHVLVQTFWVDVVCYVCLIAQFGVQTMFADREYLAVAEVEEQKTFFRAMSNLSSTFRSAASSLTCFDHKTSNPALLFRCRHITRSVNFIYDLHVAAQILAGRSACRCMAEEQGLFCQHDQGGRPSRCGTGAQGQAALCTGAAPAGHL
jgi:hypothetical protein